ncbi:unnamed protein product, partial [Discosporangium mesarthrocarpum]
METMKSIKRLQRQKESLGKKQKQAKSDYDKVKAELQARMNEYQEAQMEFDGLEEGQPSRDEAEARMGRLLDTIESMRVALMGSREEVEKARKDIRKVDGRLMEGRAELVASCGLLDQNETLRAVIAADEREKFESEKEALVEAAVGEEKKRMEEEREELEKTVDEVRQSFGRKEEELRGVIAHLNKEKKEMLAKEEGHRSEREELENRLADAEV